MSDTYCAPDCDERTACLEVGGLGHFYCGFCPEHEEPRHHCGCMVIERIQRYCATCNEPEFSEYAANCRAHTPDNMIEA